MTGKKTTILNGTLMFPLEVGSRAMIFSQGHFIHTSRIVAIHDCSQEVIRFETMNTNYTLLCPTPQMATAPALMGLAA